MNTNTDPFWIAFNATLGVICALAIIMAAVLILLIVLDRVHKS